jgi:hypothetical protein
LGSDRVLAAQWAAPRACRLGNGFSIHFVGAFDDEEDTVAQSAFVRYAT